MCLLWKDASKVLQALRKPQEDLRGDMYRLIGEVDMGLKLGESMKIESPSLAMVSLKPIPSRGAQPTQI